jgi:hypothetical protein
MKKVSIFLGSKKVGEVMLRNEVVEVQVTIKQTYLVQTMVGTLCGDLLTNSFVIDKSLLKRKKK